MARATDTERIDASFSIYAQVMTSSGISSANQRGVSEGCDGNLVLTAKYY